MALEDETQELWIEVGRTLLICALVERHIKHLSRSFEVADWLEFKASDISMNNAIEGMRKQFDIEDDFVRTLHEFRVNRNKFVHETWDLSSTRLSSDEGRKDTLSFIVALYATASSLNRIMYPHVLAQYASTGEEAPDWKPILLSTPTMKGAHDTTSRRSTSVD